MWRLLERPDPFTIVEQGAHHGDLAKDVLEVARETEPEFFGALRYCIVEPFPILRSRQGKTLGALAPGVSWRNGLDELEPFCGVHFSYELIDSMPVHLVSCEAPGEWQEKFVAGSGNDFVLVKKL